MARSASHASSVPTPYVFVEGPVTDSRCRAAYENTEITTRSDPDAFPSALRQKRKTQTKLHDQGDQGTLVSEKCPACGALEAYSKEIRWLLRSADEGSTIFTP
ncbi:hypothetical protein B0H10DRAFT_2043094, partial [Mycena sp. CBHHK59/15]